MKRMKKNIIYVVAALIVGLLGGYTIFSPKQGLAEQRENHQHTEEVSSGQMWTCSMHPQIMQPEPGDCPICGMDLIPAADGTDGLMADQFKMTDNAAALANIKTMVVGSQNTNAGILKLSGKIRENEESNAVQVSYFAGRIEKLFVNSTGERVRKGQRLAIIYSPELVSAQQELLTAFSLKESQPVLYKAVRNKLKLWKLSEDQINSVEQAGKVQENFPIYATVSGTVTHKMAEEGDYVKQGQPLYKIANLSTVWAEFDAYENQIAFLKEGQNLKVVTNAYPNQTFDGKITFIDPVLNVATRTIVVRTVLNNQNDRFKPGMFVEGRIERKKIELAEAVIVPTSAVMWTGERSVVYLKTDPEQPIFEMREVRIGEANGDTYAILDGLKNGDEIVVNGTFTVDAAAQLLGKKSMMNTSGGKTRTGHEGHLGIENPESSVSTTNTDHSRMDKRLEVPNGFKNQLQNVFEVYLFLKDALVMDNPSEVQKSADMMLLATNKVNMSLLEDKEGHDHWMALHNEIKSSATAISQASELQPQRNHFKHLSSHLSKAISLFGVNQKVYSKFCPMADKNKGAYWLSLEEGIRNPYFGQKMLTCGEVKQLIE